jgi:hypothetical protein
MKESVDYSFIAFVIASAWIVFVFISSMREKRKFELNNKLIDRFSNMNELNNFLKSDSGSEFLKSLTIEGIAPKEKLLKSISTGIILGVLGIALFFVGKIFTAESRYFNAGAIIAIALGLGYLISTVVSVFLSKKWGIIDKE